MRNVTYSVDTCAGDGLDEGVFNSQQLGEGLTLGEGLLRLRTPLSVGLPRCLASPVCQRAAYD